MDDQNQQDHKPSESSAMAVEDQNSPGRPRQGPSLRGRPPHRQSSRASSHAAQHNPGSRHDQDMDLGPSGQHGQAKVEAKHSSQPTERISQNRAPFGKWKSKMIYGYPDPETPLPPGITATQICQTYPNHVNDEVILALMREGKGAKAIDSLIPAPAGKEKAGQSHSKIQLRVTTIREAYPYEDFPIASTKRKREPSKSLDGQRIDSAENDEVSVDILNSSNSAVAGPSNNGGNYMERTQNLDFLEGLHLNSPPRTAGLVFYARPRGITSQTRQTQVHSGPEDFLGSSPPANSSAASTNRIPILREQIRREYQRHLQLVFDVFYIDQPLPPSEMKDTIRAHCTEYYEGISQELQARCGSKLDKTITPDGLSEHPISYLERSISHCFGIIPELQESVVLDCPEDQQGNRRDAAVLRNLLGHMLQWTRILESKLEIQRQIRAHKNAHAVATGGQDRGRSDQGMANNDLELSMLEQSNRPADNVTKGLGITISGAASGQEDQVMTDAPQTSERPKHEFEEYMEEVDQFVKREARAINLTPISALSPDTTIRIFKPPTNTIDPSSSTPLSTLSDDNFILHGWEVYSRHVFGDEAEARVAAQRDALFEIGENEMRKYVLRGLEMQGEDEVADKDGVGGGDGNWKGKGKGKGKEVHFQE